MAIGVLVLGESGTGKTYSIKNLNPDEVKILSVQKPILPFRGKYDVVKTPTGDDIIRELKNTKKKVIVIDDFQYVLGIPMMQRIGEKGWEKFNDIQQGYSDVLDAVNDLPDDTIVYFTSHVMYNDDTGKTQIKTIGKALDKYLTVEGLFMIVLGTQVVENHYYFITQNNGSNTLKSPEGMFPTLAIPNDLAYVTDKIRNYYYMEGSKSDAEMKAEDEANAVDDSALVKKSRRERRNEELGKEKEEKLAETSAEEAKEEPTRKSRRSVKKEADAAIDAARTEFMNIADAINNDDDSDEKPFDQYETPEPVIPSRRKRDTAEQPAPAAEPETNEGDASNETSESDDAPIRRRRRRA